MTRFGKVYTGPKLPFWKHLGLLYARSLAALLSLALVFMVVIAVFAGRLPLFLVFVVAAGAMLSLVAASVWAARERDRLVRAAPLPRFLRQKLLVSYPHLTQRDAELVERGLRQFFIACQRSRRRFVAMPSQVVDSMWHEFILHTSAYREWCDLVVGRFIDHVPAEVLGRKASTNDGLRRAWFWACRDESIDPKKPSRLPLLFALDAKFAIPGGFAYVADCRGVRRDGGGGGGHCGESFSDGSYSGDADGFGGSDSSSSSGDGGGDGGSDGNAGCGGGGD